MALENKINQLDIISKLIDMQLEDIAGDILVNLSDMDIANAVVANPKWSAFASTRRGRVKTLISRNKSKSAPLKTFYRREELLSRQMQESPDAHSLFLKACTGCSSLSKFCSESLEEQGVFRLPLPSDDAVTVFSIEIHVSDEFIVLETQGIRNTLPRSEPKMWITCSIHVFDRWTFQLVNSLTLECGRFHLYFVEGGITCFSKGDRLFLWGLTTGKLHAMPSPAITSDGRVFCIAQLIVVFFRDKEDLFAIVYKVHGQDDSIATTCIAKYRETLPLDAFYDVWQISSAKDLDWIAICAFRGITMDAVYQLRSKEDFSLLRTLPDLENVPLRGRFSFLLSAECFALNCNFAEFKFVHVISFSNAELRTVYRFCLPEKMPRPLDFNNISWPKVLTVGRFLVLYFDWGGGLNAAIWKLPPNFIETCQRHLNEGTVGTTSQCDQLIFEEPAESSDRLYRYDRVDQFGILKCRIDAGNAQFMQLTMLNSIISEGEGF